VYTSLASKNFSEFKGKPAERQRRKAMGLQVIFTYDCQVAKDQQIFVFDLSGMYLIPSWTWLKYQVFFVLYKQTR